MKSNKKLLASALTTVGTLGLLLAPCIAQADSAINGFFGINQLSLQIRASVTKAGDQLFPGSFISIYDGKVSGSYKATSVVHTVGTSTCDVMTGAGYTYQIPGSPGTLFSNITLKLCLTGNTYTETVDIAGSQNPQNVVYHSEGNLLRGGAAFFVNGQPMSVINAR